MPTGRSTTFRPPRLARREHINAVARLGATHSALAQIVATAALALRVPVAGVALADGEGLRIVCVLRHPDSPEAAPGLADEQRLPFAISDVPFRTLTEEPAAAEFLRAHGLKALATAAITDSDDVLVGELLVCDNEVRQFDEREFALLSAIAASAERELSLRVELEERNRAELAAWRREAILEAVGFAAERFLKSSDAAIGVRETLERLARALNVSRAYVLENAAAASDAPRMVLRWEWTALGPSTTLAPFDGACGAETSVFKEFYPTLMSGEPIHGRVEDFALPVRASLEAQAVESLVLLPIFVGARFWGVAGFDDCDLTLDWSDAERDALRAVGGLIGSALARSEMEQKLAHSNEQLRHAVKMEAVGQLAGGIAHDFNNLLAATLVNCSVLRDSLSAQPKELEEVEEIRRASERGARMIRELLAFSRKQSLEPCCVQLNDVVRDVQRLLSRLLAADVEFVIDLGENAGSIVADPSQLSQVLMNLVVNARDAMPNGGRLRVATRAAELSSAELASFPDAAAGRFAELVVSDTGAGMDPVTKERAFEPFFTTKGPGRGTGLGLSTVYGIVRQSGGFIELTSGVNQGTSCRILFPSHAAVAERPSERQVASGKLDLRGSETVLVVEDEPILRGTLRRLMARYGYDVLVAKNGREALEVLERMQGAVDLLLTDVVMPEMGGRELVERVRDLWPRIRVVFMSGYAENEIRDRGALPEANGFVPKPFKPGQLALAVRDALTESDEVTACVP